MDIREKDCEKKGINRILGKGVIIVVTMKKILLSIAALLVCGYVSAQNQTLEGTHVGYEWVDLGLPSGLKWAKHNLGASVLSDVGDYYAWGEITTKSCYSGANSRTYRQPIGDVSGNPQYDAARAVWGGLWRMPTREEYTELIEKCEWEVVFIVDVYAYKVTGPNGNYIFLPATGWRMETQSFDVGELCCYWTSTPDTDVTRAAFALYAGGSYMIGQGSRGSGRAVRAVLD